jgi:hypothetical protein
VATSLIPPVYGQICLVESRSQLYWRVGIDFGYYSWLTPLPLAHLNCLLTPFAIMVVVQDHVGMNRLDRRLPFKNRVVNFLPFLCREFYGWHGLNSFQNRLSASRCDRSHSTLSANLDRACRVLDDGSSQRPANFEIVPLVMSSRQASGGNGNGLWVTPHL